MSTSRALPTKLPTSTFSCSLLKNFCTTKAKKWQHILVYYDIDYFEYEFVLLGYVLYFAVKFEILLF